MLLRARLCILKSIPLVESKSVLAVEEFQVIFGVAAFGHTTQVVIQRRDNFLPTQPHKERKEKNFMDYLIGLYEKKI